MSVEQPLPREWIEDLEEDIPIQVDQDRLEALGFMKTEEHGSYERWEGGLYQIDYHSGTEEIVDYEQIDQY